MTKPKENYLYQVIYRISICVLPLVITPYLAHTLSPEGNGLYALSSAVACYFIMFAKLGLDHYGSKMIALCRDDPVQMRSTFWSIYVMQVCTSLLSVLVYLPLIWTVFRGDSLIYLMQLPYVLSAMFDISWLFFGMEDFRPTTVRSVAVRVLIIACVFLFVRTEADVWVYTLIMSLCFLLEQVLLLPFALKHVLPVPRICWADVKAHIRPNLKLFLPLAALSVYHWMDKLMLGMITGNAAVAYYNYADSIVNLPKGIVVALGTVMLPRISRLAAKGDQKGMQQSLRQSVTLICFVCCVLCFGIAAIAPVFVPYFLGPDYQITVWLVMELALVMIPMSLIDTFQMQYLIPCGMEKTYTRSVFTGALANMLLNALLIPFLGETGAVLGTIGAEMTVCVYQAVSIRKVYAAEDLYKALWPFLLAGVLEFFCVLALGRLSLPVIPLLILQVGAGGAVYLGTCALIVRFWRKDLQGLIHSLRT